MARDLQNFRVVTTVLSHIKSYIFKARDIKKLKILPRKKPLKLQVQLFKTTIRKLAVVRCVYGSNWIGLKDFFDPTQKFRLVGLVTQPDPKIFTTQPSIFGLG